MLDKFKFWVHFGSMVQMKVEKPEQVKHSSFQIQLTQNYIKYTAIKVGTA